MSRFDFIGFYETRREDIRRLSVELDLPLSDQVHENPTPDDAQGSRAELESQVGTVACLKDLLAGDVAFYEAQRSLRQS